MLSLLLLALQPPADPTIVVSGERKTDAQIREEAHSFVRAVAAAPGTSGQLGRWNDPICPKVLGANPDEEAAVLERIRAVAAESGIRQSKLKRCTPNIMVAFTHEPGNIVRRVLEKRPHAARTMPVSMRSDLVEGSYPVRWWYELKTESRFGQAPAGDHPALLGALTTTANGPGAGAGGQIAQSENQAGNVSDYSSSLISSKTRQSIGGATVIVDVNKIRGRSNEALASFIAMVALAPLKLPPRAVATPTITNLFTAASAEDRPDDLSEWDRAYIAALYKTAADRTAKAQSGAMTARIARTMRGEN